MKTALRLVHLMVLSLTLLVAQQGSAFDVKNPLSTKPFGPKLANKVAKRIDHMGADQGLYYTHRDDDGTGIVKDPKQFKVFWKRAGQTEWQQMENTPGIFVGNVYDGSMIFVQYYFATTAEFQEWLAKQSDASMGVCSGNEGYCAPQMLTRQRLVGFVDGR